MKSSFKFRNAGIRIIWATLIMFLLSCIDRDQEQSNMVTMKVTATAYNSVERQTKKGNIGLAAWGDKLAPGERAVAVSRDLIKMGLDHNEEIEIEGLEGTYIVKDKMNKRWKKKIDIYMGLDEEAAREWGKRKVEIRYNRKNKPSDKFSKEMNTAK